MKDKILHYWNKSSYIIRSVIVYTFFSVLAIGSKLLDDKLGMVSSMVAIGFLVSMLSVVASVIYVLIMSTKRKIAFREIFLAVCVVILFLFLMNLILPTKIKEEKRVPEVMIHNVIDIPVAQKEK